MLPRCDLARSGDRLPSHTRSSARPPSRAHGPLPFVLTFTLALVIAAGVVASGCGSTCATNCPAIVFDIFATPGDNLNIATAQLVGPGCPLELSNCRGDLSGANPCARISLLASQPGLCELDLTFSDGRPQTAIQTEFGPETHQGCCHGFPVIGPASYTVPPLHPVGGFDAATDSASGSDAAPDAVTSDTTGGSDADASADVGD
jgi:hypothetical protein